MVNIYQKINNKFFAQFGFYIENISTTKIVDHLYESKDSSSLAVTRILFGLAMLFDIPDERGGAAMNIRWGNPRTCHFPLFPFIQAMSMPNMALVYFALWFGAVGIMLGFQYNITAPLFTVSYWYLFLIDKSFWNNHSYLFGLIGLLLSCTQANCYWSLDVYLDPSKEKQTVPYWNYFILKYQFFILYFMAGLKKGTAEWLTGYSVPNLSEHWVFDPFKYFLTVPQTDYLIVHWFVFVFDLTVAIWMMWSRTRHIAMVFCALFHLMNSRLFKIGMFPWVCLATMPLFYPFDWPKRVEIYCTMYYRIMKNLIWKEYLYEGQDNETNIPNAIDEGQEQSNDIDTAEESFCEENNNVGGDFGVSDLSNLSNNDDCDDGEHLVTPPPPPSQCNKKLVVLLIGLHCFLQAFLPYSHFITKGYNNWTNGLYGYSWDMMVHTWDSGSVSIRIVDNDNNKGTFIDPELYALNDRWSRHGDMVYQYAQCIRDHLKQDSQRSNWKYPISDNISIYIDIWSSMNGRFTQRMFDSKVDMLAVEWSPFREVSFLVPLLNDETIPWREVLKVIRDRVHSWSERSDVLFYVDFPGYEHEKFISTDLKNVTFNVLQGEVAYEPMVMENKIVPSFKVTPIDRVSIAGGTFHKIVNIGREPAFYLYTFYNASQPANKIVVKEKLPVIKELSLKFYKMLYFGKLLADHLIQLLYFKTCG